MICETCGCLKKKSGDADVLLLVLLSNMFEFYIEICFIIGFSLKYIFAFYIERCFTLSFTLEYVLVFLLREVLLLVLVSNMCLEVKVLYVPDLCKPLPSLTANPEHAS